ncbi:component of small subunit processosome [Suhomyces tanzawaensis NRRL Y-17324]|uniref:Component of small subunit processosome n=1 Tax=Suhomyces tanzawaensis NRRL Y-17324 TaxID=984487 RepID=A0A1E4SRM4_9ASCO|nr:component of small subunit processosome [Suhomyces tanzawaensis NRRL Y-17324]ODV82159.1 component of small subunit processosome [Suhomyces tanzawaensis NRRL Y-17324]
MAGDPFLSDPSKKRKNRSSRTTSVAKKSRSSKADSAPARHKRQTQQEEDEITDGSDSETEQVEFDAEQGSEELSSDEEFADENATDKRRRLAQQYLDNLGNQLDGGEEFDAKDLDDDILARRLQVDVAENKGYIYKFFGEQVSSQKESTTITTTRIGSKHLTALAVRYPYLYTVSKDIELIKWNISLDKKKPQRIKHIKGHRKNTKGHSDQINCVAVSSDGKFVVTGGMDSKLIIWSSENLAVLKVLETRAPVNAITFRRGTDQLYAACADLKIRTYSINQFTQLEILYGHQDNITDISSMAKETCVSVGSRDKTAMFWKIAEESRLTFRGGDFEKKKKKRDDEPEVVTYNEGAIEVVSMCDESKFVTGSDNGNVSFWSLAKKKPLSTQRLSHGLQPALASTKASAEVNEELSTRQVPQRQPYPITAIHSVPFSDIFITGSYDGSLRVWRIDQQNMRNFEMIGEIAGVKGCVVKIDSAEEKGKLVVFALVSKEHRLGRWLGKIEGGRNALVSFAFDV